MTKSRSKPGAIVRAVRERWGLTQAALAKELGVDVTTVSRWERGVRKPNKHTLEVMEVRFARPDGA